MRTEVLKVPAVHGGWTALLNKGQATGGAGKSEAGGMDSTGGTWQFDLLALKLRIRRVLLGAEY